jgi:hypothetical protein
MSFRSIVAFASVSLLLSFATGCAAEASSSETGETSQTGEAALMNPNDEGSFKLYDEGSAGPDASCDLHTVLELEHPSAYAPLQAMLHEALDGVCKIAVNADERAYTLKLDHVDCGSKIYKGTSLAGGKRELTITDHRTRVCRDMVPAEIVVEETDLAARARTLFSYDTPRAR